MEFRKMVMMTLYIRDSKRDTDIKNRLLNSKKNTNRVY